MGVLAGRCRKLHYRVVRFWVGIIPSTSPGFVSQPQLCRRAFGSMVDGSAQSATVFMVFLSSPSDCLGCLSSIQSVRSGKQYSPLQPGKPNYTQVTGILHRAKAIYTIAQEEFSEHEEISANHSDCTLLLSVIM